MPDDSYIFNEMAAHVFVCDRRYHLNPVGEPRDYCILPFQDRNHPEIREMEHKEPRRITVIDDPIQAKALIRKRAQAHAKPPEIAQESAAAPTASADPSPPAVVAEIVPEETSEAREDSVPETEPENTPTDSESAEPVITESAPPEPDPVAPVKRRRRKKAEENNEQPSGQYDADGITGSTDSDS